jgi:KDO2-lipid IV(A) lauroyltransferase
MARKRSTRARVLPRLVSLARALPPSAVLRARPALALAFAAVPGWRARVRDNMRAALGADAVPEAAVRQYFERLADLLAFSTVIWRGDEGHPALAREWVHDPEARRLYLEALAKGRGVVLVCPHLTGTEIMTSTFAREAPVAILARKAPDAEYEALKQQWYGKLGVEVIHRPPRDAAHGPLVEMTSIVRALKNGRILAITPDLPQKAGKGVPVRLFGRPVSLPAGPFFVANRTGAPLMPSFFHRENGQYHLWTHPPLDVSGPDRDTAISTAAQAWADLFEAVVREHPDMWQFWLDKRWTQWLHETPPE